MQLVPEQRARFLDEACASDDALRAEVESLLLGRTKVSAPASCNRRRWPTDWARTTQTKVGSTLHVPWKPDRSLRSVFNSSASLVKAAWAKSGWRNRPPRCGGKWP